MKLNFEREGSDQGATDAGLQVIYLPLQPEGDLKSIVEAPDAATIERAVGALTTADTLVHCTHGQDRTGLVTGALRVTVYGEKKSGAWKEMIEHGYHWDLPALTYWWLDWNGTLPGQSARTAVSP